MDPVPDLILSFKTVEEIGRKVFKSMAELKRMDQDRKKWKYFTEDPPTLISN